MVRLTFLGGINGSLLCLQGNLFSAETQEPLLSTQMETCSSTTLSRRSLLCIPTRWDLDYQFRRGSFSYVSTSGRSRRRHPYQDRRKQLWWLSRSHNGELVVIESRFKAWFDLRCPLEASHVTLRQLTTRSSLVQLQLSLMWLPVILEPGVSGNILMVLFFWDFHLGIFQGFFHHFS